VLKPRHPPRSSALKFSNLMLATNIMRETPPIIDVYQDIAETTERMLSHAMASQWDQVIALAPQYHNAVEKLYEAGVVPPEELARRRSLITEILDNDAAIRRLASPELERLNELISGLRRQRNVLQAYYAPHS